MIDAAERAHQNLCDFTRFQARLEPGSDLLDDAGVVATAGPVDFPTSRSAIRSNRAVSASAWGDALIRFLDSHGKTGCTYARVGTDDDLTSELANRGFREWSQSPEMVCDHRLDAREPPAGVAVRWASSAADIAAYANIAGKAFTHLSVPEGVTRSAIDNPDVLLGSDCVVALAELNGAPVAGALVVLFGTGLGPTGCAGYVGWVACLDAARGHGLGDVVTRAVTNEAFARGASLVTLEASEFGESTYKRMGYREIYRYRVLVRL